MQVLRILIGLALLAGTAPAMSARDEPQPGEINPAEVVQVVPGMPHRGTTKATVRKRLGDPVRTVPAVGDPPISQWVYDDFTVYFEYNRVIHSVKNRKHDGQ